MASGGSALPESSWRQGAGVSLRGREQQYAHGDFHYRGPPRQEYDQWRPRGLPGSGFEQQDWQAPGSGYRAHAPPTFQGGRDYNFRDPMHNRDFHNRDFRDVNRDFNRDIHEQPAFHRDFREFNRSSWRDDRGLDMPRAGMEQALPTRWSGGRVPAPFRQSMMSADEQSAMERMLPAFLHSKTSPSNDAMPEEWPDEPSSMAPTSVASQSSMWSSPAVANSGFPATADVGSVSVGAGLSSLNPVASALQPRTEPPWPSAGETMASNAVSSHLAALTGSAGDQYTLNEAEALVAASVLKPLDPFSSSGGSPPAVAAIAAPMHTGSEQLVGRQSANVLINQLFPIVGASTEPTHPQTTEEIEDRAVPPAEAVSTRAPERSDAPVEPQQRQTAAAQTSNSNAQGVPVSVVTAMESPAAQPQASASQSPALGASPEDAVKAREQWQYIDHSGALQGPYRQAVMSAWFRGKYFFPTLRIRRAIDSEFVQLSALALLLHFCASFDRNLMLTFSF